jgi:predicted RNA-binding Zn-ribbon protein involved in translation (DUF1610 family)
MVHTKEYDFTDFTEMQRTTKPLSFPCPICGAEYKRCPITQDIREIKHDNSIHFPKS